MIKHPYFFHKVSQNISRKVKHSFSSISDCCTILFKILGTGFMGPQAIQTDRMKHSRRR